ncbi:MAG TPA: hypothetical protein VM901_12160 [Bdellovibrionota bacterium]|jgi:hypothetical protein|nr:hypothetical protein [Bdellovibrionota bacterium]
MNGFRKFFISTTLLASAFAWATPKTIPARVAQATYDYRKAAGALISESVDGFVKVGVRMALDGAKGFAVASLVTDVGNAGGVYQVYRVNESSVPMHLASLALFPEPNITLSKGGVGSLISVGYPKAGWANEPGAAIVVSSMSLQSDSVASNEPRSFPTTTVRGKKEWTAFAKTLPAANAVVYCNFKKDKVLEPCAE